MEVLVDVREGLVEVELRIWDLVDLWPMEVELVRVEEEFLKKFGASFFFKEMEILVLYLG